MELRKGTLSLPVECGQHGNAAPFAAQVRNWSCYYMSKGQFGLCSSRKFALTWRRLLELPEAISEESGPSRVVGSPPSTSTKPVKFFIKTRACTAGLQSLWVSFTSGLPGVLLRITQNGHIRCLHVHYIWLWHWLAVTCRNCLHLPVLNIHFYHIETHRSRNSG